jgi:Ser/Thr protein kinase RdoA (MazF antagonist)
MERAAAALICPACGARLAVRGDVLECPSGHTRLVVVGRASGRSETFVLRDDAGRKLLLKLPNDAYRAWSDEPLDRRAAWESEVMARVGAALDGDFRVPRVVPATVPGAAILMEHVEGRPLEHALYGRDAWLRPRRVARGFASAGRWAAALGRHTASGPDPFRHDTLSRTTRLVEAIADAGFPRAHADRLLELVRELGARLAGRSFHRCIVQGDFKPEHVYVTPDATTVIDFETAFDGWVHQDAAEFTAAIEGRSAKHPLRRVSPGGFAARRSFLSAYLAEALPGWDELAPLFRVEAMIGALHSEYEGGFARRRPRLFEAIVVSHYRRWFDAAEAAARRPAGRDAPGARASRARA